jgi:RNA-directed DNA polymerase
VDGESFLDIEAYGVERWLAALTQELKDWTYQPKPPGADPNGLYRCG